MQECLLLNTTGYYPYGGEWFTTHPVEIMTSIFLLLVILLIINLKTIIRQFSKVNRKTWVILLIIFLAGFWLRNAEYIYGHGYDGYFYLNCAKYMLEKDLQVWSCAIGNNDRCYLYNQHLAPAGYPYLIFLSFLFFGVHDIFAMMISGILSSFTIILVFLFTYLFFKNERIGLYAAAVLSFMPFEIFISSTSAVRPTSLFFIALTMVIYYIALKKDDIKLWSLLAIAFSYTLYVRAENFLLLFPMVAMFFIEKRFNFGDFKKVDWFKVIKKYWIPVLILIVSQIPLQHWVLLSSHKPPGWINPYNLPFASYLTIYSFFSNPLLNQTFYNPIISALLFISALLLLKKKHRNQIIVVWIWFLSYLLMHSIYYICDGFPENICMDYLRFMQHLHIPYAILVGVLFFSMEGLFKKRRNLILLFILIFIFFTNFMFPTILEPKTSLFRDARLEEQYAGDVIIFINTTPKDSVIFLSQAMIPNFDYFKGDKRNIIDLPVYSSMNYTYTIDLLKENMDKPTFLIEDWACSYPDYCKFISDNFEFSEISRKNQVRFIRLKPKKNSFIV